MKKLSIISIALVLLSACSKEFLDQTPPDQLTSEAYYKDVEQLKRGVLGSYTPLQASYNGGNVAWTLGILSDEFGTWKDQSTPAEAFNINGFTKTNAFSQGAIWVTAYNNIALCNRMISVIEAKNFTVAPAEEATVNALLGEVRFIRALNYFNLVRFYGDVTLVTKPFVNASEAVGLGRTSVQKIYDEVIIPDFKYAGENCFVRSKIPPAELGRVTSGAGYTMLGKVYLTLKRYTDAEAALKKVIASNEYDILPQFAQVFALNNENNKESIFEIQYNEDVEDGSTFHRWIGYEAAPFLNLLASNQSVWVTRDLINAYKSTGDLVRFNVSIVDSTTNPSSNVKIFDPYPKKLITTTVGQQLNQNNNFMVTRYADVLLMHAEAVIMQSAGRAGEVLADVNKIRSRASMPLFSVADITLDKLLQERRVELAFEGHRYFDLVRTERAITVLSAHLGRTIPATQLLFPLPTTELQKDPSLIQNPGY